ncbi:MAG TPA: heparinase II/III family protein [Myxococcota bacterium]|nr:heparinase II/III family protein [Myxococcota bacterium]
MRDRYSCLVVVVAAALLSLPRAPRLSAAPAGFVFHDYLVYDDLIGSIEGGAVLSLGEWDYHDSQGNWIEVPRVINGSLAGPGLVTSKALNGMNADPGWTTIAVQGSSMQIELRGAEDDGQRRGHPGAWGGWVVSDGAVPLELRDMQYLSWRLTLAAGDVVTQVDLSLTREIPASHPRLLVEDVSALGARCQGALSHQCDMNAMFANSAHLSNPLTDYDDSQAARVAKVMAFQYLLGSQTAHADRARELLLKLAANDRQHWVDLRDQVQDLGLGWIGLSWMLALDWTFEDLKNHPADLQSIADGSCVFADYLLEMYKHSDFNNHFYLGRAPVLLLGLVLHGEGLRDADAERYLAAGFDFLFNHEHPALNSVAGEMGGWHESLGYFDGEMGYPMLVDMDGLRTATGLDFFQDSSFWRSLPFWYLASTVPRDGTLIHWADQGKDRWSQALDGSQSEGKGVRDYLTGLHSNLARLGYPEAEYAQYLLDDRIGAYYDSGGYAESYYKVALMNDVLWYQQGATTRTLPAGRMSSHFADLGEVIMREGNQLTDALAMFACARFRGGHQQADNGHFSVWRKGYLAVDSGYYDHWGSAHHYNYARRTIAHNTLTVSMPGEIFSNTDHNDGGQSLGCNTDYYNSPIEDPDCDTCRMVLSTRADPYFDFISADLTNSYNPDKVSRVTREFVWLRPDRFVVFDRIESRDASFKKRFLLHGQAEFVDDGGAWRVDDGQGRLFVKTLLPQGAEVVQLGGSGYEWEIDGVNYPPADGVEFAGTHRLEISPAAPASFDNFLHAFQLVDQDVAAMEPAELLQSSGASGVFAGDWVVWFGTSGPIDGLSYEFDAGRPVHVVVGDLAAASAYDVKVGDATFTSTSDEHGVLFFEDERSDGHTVIVGAGTSPDGGNGDGVDAGGDDGGGDADAGADGNGEAADGVHDDGITPADTSGRIEGGCGCSATGSTAGLGWFILLIGIVHRRKKGCEARNEP